MAGQGFHLGTNKRLIEKIDPRIFTDERFIAGTLVPDALKTIGGTRRNSHYCGGDTLKYPIYERLDTFGIDDLNLEYREEEKSYICDPEIRLAEFFENNKHISNNDPYKIGILMHLLTDHEYDKFIAQRAFDLSKQSEGIILHKGKSLTNEEFRNILYSYLYPGLDQYSYMKHNITKEDLEYIRKVIANNFSTKPREFLLSYTKWDSSKTFEDNEYFKTKQIDNIYEQVENEYPKLIKKHM